MAQATFKSKGPTTVHDIVIGAVNADLLVLDEIGVAPLTNWEYKNILFPILNGRLGKKSKSIFTTNLDLGRLANWFAYDKDSGPLDEDGRLIDRLIGACDIVKNNGTSKRREDAERRMKAQ